jgi:nucleotide-binding universal stress UspA family protein
VRPDPLRLRLRPLTRVGPYRRIVVGTDGSDSAGRAVGHAAWLAGALGAELLVSHAYREVTEEATGPRRMGSSVLRDACAMIAEVGPRPVLRTGEAAESLVSLAREEDAGLIVVGNRGLGTRRVLMGTVPGRVAQRAPCDVLIAHTTGELEAGYRRILLATDRSPTAQRAVAVGTELAEALGSGREELQVTEGDAADGIVRAAADRPADLVVMGNKGLTGARRFLASVPSRVARRAPCHVLLVKTT